MRFVPSKKASCSKNAKSVIMLKSKLMCRLKCHIRRQLCFFKQKSVFQIRSDNFLDDGKNISLRGGEGGGFILASCTRCERPLELTLCKYSSS